MKSVRNDKISESKCVTELLLASLKVEDLSGITDMLECICNSLNAVGCIIWEAALDFDITASTPVGHLEMVDQWFDGIASHVRTINVSDSIAGKAIFNQRPSSATGITSIKRTCKSNSSFLLDNGINVVLSLPLVFFDSNIGALNIYRKHNQFSDKERTILGKLANLLVQLYQTIRERSGFRLHAQINKILVQETLNYPDTPKSIDEVREIMLSICMLISKSFHCTETSIFLSDYFKSPNKYELLATTDRNMINKTYYTNRSRRSLTGYVIRKKHTSILIPDLCEYDRDKEKLQKQYSKFDWDNTFFKERPDFDVIKPVSFMACPIAADDDIIGVIRCSNRISGPYRFGQNDLEILERISSQLIQYWINWLYSTLIQRQNQDWKRLAVNLRELNNDAYHELSKENPTQTILCQKCLKYAVGIFKVSSSVDIRLLDDNQQLYYAFYIGRQWDDADLDYISKLKEIKYDCSKPANSIGAIVVQTRKYYKIDNLNKRHPYYKNIFRGTKHFLATPIQVGDSVFGVLEILRSDDIPFSPFDVTAAIRIGQQLGFFLHLYKILTELRETQTERDKNILQQSQILEDLQHQLRSPILQIYKRIHQVSLPPILPKEQADDIRAIKGLSAKAVRVTHNIKIFASLARDEPIKVNASRINRFDLERWLIEAASDNQVLCDPERHLRFHVDTSSFRMLDRLRVRMDQDLIEQALNNLLDNALKYSYRNTIVTISGGITKKDKFFISVSNSGIKMKPNLIDWYKDRMTQGEDAKAVSGEGSGIGLWLVDNIMKAHGGVLHIDPKDKKGLTNIRLLFDTE